MAHAAMMLTLQDDPVSLGRAVAALSDDSHVTLGVPRGTRLPLLYDTSHAAEVCRVAHAFRELPGVEVVDLVWVDYDATDTFDDEVIQTGELEVASFEIPLGQLPS